MALSKWVAVIGMLAFGTVSSIMSKVNFEVRGVNLNGKVVPFHKPWFCVLVMFVGMSGCLLLFVSSLVSPLLARPAKAKESRKYKKLMTDNPSLGGDENAYLQALIDDTEPSRSRNRRRQPRLHAGFLSEMLSRHTERFRPSCHRADVHRAALRHREHLPDDEGC